MNERQFINKGHYFVLIEPVAWIEHVNKETRQIERKEITGWSKTHIITQKSAMSDKHGLQIIRWTGKTLDPNELELASNPYAGVYLSPDEWAQVLKTLPGGHSSD